MLLIYSMTQADFIVNHRLYTDGVVHFYMISKARYACGKFGLTVKL